ncbi:MAG: membrane protein insertion efficiency factor YidD [Kiritimatiellia bacterium]
MYERGAILDRLSPFLRRPVVKVITGLSVGLLIFFALPLHAATSELAMANALFQEGDWAGCVTECRRVEAAEPGHQDAVRLRGDAEKRLRGSVRQNGWWRRAGEWPVKGLVGFYRFAVAPAIGSRCILEPSCSRYAMESARQAGWLSIPMMGDRLIREPSVVQEAARPVRDAGGGIRYADPVADHVGIAQSASVDFLPD